MSLNWDATEVKDTRAIGVGIPEAEMSTADKIEWALTEQVIFASMVTGLGKKWAITEEDAPEIFDRMSAYEHAIDGPVKFLEESKTKGAGREELVSRWLTFEDITKRIGLKTNVSPVSRAKFERTLGEILMRHAAIRRVK